MNTYFFKWTNFSIPFSYIFFFCQIQVVKQCFYFKNVNHRSLDSMDMSDFDFILFYIFQIAHHKHITTLKIRTDSWMLFLI